MRHDRQQTRISLRTSEGIIYSVTVGAFYCVMA